MIVGASYDGENITLTYSNGSTTTVPFTPRILIPHSLSPYLPHHLTTLPAPGGLYVEAPYPTLLRLYQRLIKLSPAVIFPPPERQFLLLNNLRPFSDGLRLDLPTFSSALYHLLRTPQTPNPSLTFLENTLFLHGYARPLTRISHISVDWKVFLPFFHFNIDDSTFSPDGEILLPTSPVLVKGIREVHSVHPLIGKVSLSGKGIVTLADALLYDLPHEIVRETRTTSQPSFLHREILSLIDLFLSSLRSTPSELFPEDSTSFNLLIATYSILRRLPSLLINTYTLGRRARNTLLALYNLLRRDPNLYNLLVGENHTCCPALNELGSYLPVLSSLLTEPLPL